MSTFPPDAYPQEQNYPNIYLHPYHLETNVFSRVIPPAVCLFVLALLNLLFGMCLIVNAIRAKELSDDQMEKIVKQVDPKHWEEKIAGMRDNGITAKWIYTTSRIVWSGGGGLNIFISLLAIFGSVRMMMLRSHALAVFVSVLTAIPCVSPSACCLIGEFIGIWALAVLLRPDIRSAFR